MEYMRAEIKTLRHILGELFLTFWETLIAINGNNKARWNIALGPSLCSRRTLKNGH
jgi:hypothetical protein